MRTEKALKSFVRSRSEIDFSIQNFRSYHKKLFFITPALLVNDELFSYGDINFEKLEQHLNKKTTG